MNGSYLFKNDQSLAYRSGRFGDEKGAPIETSAPMGFDVRLGARPRRGNFLEEREGPDALEGKRGKER